MNQIVFIYLFIGAGEKENNLRISKSKQIRIYCCVLKSCELNDVQIQIDWNIFPFALNGFRLLLFFLNR